MSKRIVRQINKRASGAEKAPENRSLIAGLSHEIRTPMNAIVGMTDMILADDVNERVRVYANDIKNASESLLSIVNDILDASKLEAGKMKLCEKEYSLSDVIYDVVNIIALRINPHKVDFIIDIDKELPDSLIGDSVRLRQVLINVLGNAAKFTEKGSISFFVRGSRDGDVLKIECEIKDTGCGIREENMPHLFESYTRFCEENSTEGTGLGLAITKKLIEMMGGSVTAESEYGKGSCFTFSILQQIAENGSVSVCKRSVDAEYNVLLAGENYPQFEKLKRSLEKIGVSYTVVNSFLELGAAVAENHFTHYFTTKRHYLEYQVFLNIMKDCVPVLIRQGDRRYSDISGSMVLMNQPVYCLSVLRIMEMTAQNRGREEKLRSFAAPEAKLLIVDDNPVNIRVMQGLLSKYEIHADTAASGRECLLKALQEKYDLIFMDHMMMPMDGIEAFHTLRSKADAKSCQSPVVILTATAEKGAREFFLKEGFAEHLPKPVDIEQLEEQLLMLLPQRLIKKRAQQKEEVVHVQPESIVLEGVDTQKGIKNTGSIDTYIEVLKTFCDSGRDRLAMLNDSYLAHDMERYKVEVHALKGAASAIGASQLSEEAKAQEQLLKAGKMPEEANMNLLTALYDKLLCVLEKYFEENSQADEQMQTGASEPDLQQAAEALDRITEMLKVFDDTEALQSAQKLRAHQLSADVSAALDEVIKTIKIYDYEKALKLTAQVREKFSDEGTGKKNKNSDSREEEHK